jgi:hypothetical protein
VNPKGVLGSPLFPVLCGGWLAGRHISRGNKSTRHALGQIVEKAVRFLGQGVHLLIVDLQPPGRFDPQGIHGAIWDEIAGRPYTAPADRPLTAVASESGPIFRAYIEPLAVGDPLARYAAVPPPGPSRQAPARGDLPDDLATLPPALEGRARAGQPVLPRLIGSPRRSISSTGARYAFIVPGQLALPGRR